MPKLFRPVEVVVLLWPVPEVAHVHAHGFGKIDEPCAALPFAFMYMSIVCLAQPPAWVGLHLAVPATVRSPTVRDAFASCVAKRLFDSAAAEDLYGALLYLAAAAI